jgi:DNA polymerase-3 subunit delta
MFYHGIRKKRAKAEQAARPSADLPAEFRGKRSPTSAGEGSLFTPWLNDYIDQVVASVAFSSPTEGEAKQWVHRLAKKYGKSIDDAAVQLLSKAVGMDLMALDNELAKLSSYVKDRPEIQPPDVETVVGELRVRTVWDLGDAIVLGQMRRSMSLLSRVLEAGSTTPQIVGALRWKFGQLAQGRSSGGEGATCHLPESVLEQAYTSLYMAELQVNTGRQHPRIALTFLVHRLCQLFQGQPESDQGFPRAQRT